MWKVSRQVRDPFGPKRRVRERCECRCVIHMYLEGFVRGSVRADVCEGQGRCVTCMCLEGVMV